MPSGARSISFIKFDHRKCLKSINLRSSEHKTMEIYVLDLLDCEVSCDSLKQKSNSTNGRPLQPYQTWQGNYIMTTHCQQSIRMWMMFWIMASLIWRWQNGTLHGINWHCSMRYSKIGTDMHVTAHLDLAKCHRPHLKNLLRLCPQHRSSQSTSRAHGHYHLS